MSEKKWDPLLMSIKYFIYTHQFIFQVLTFLSGQPTSGSKTLVHGYIF